MRGNADKVSGVSPHPRPCWVEDSSALLLALIGPSMTCIPSLAAGARIGHPLATGVAWFAASHLAHVRRLVRLPLSDGECHSLGLPYESTTDAVTVTPLRGTPWWRFDVWIDRDPGEHHLCIDLLGHHIEVSYLPHGVRADAC